MNQVFRIVQRVKDSLTVSVPKLYASSQGIKKGSKLEVKIEGEKLVYKPQDAKK